MREQRVIAAIGKRISQQGDMPIRISRHSMRVLLRLLGMGQWAMGDDAFREIDALALDALRNLASQRIAA